MFLAFTNFLGSSESSMVLLLSCESESRGIRFQKEVTYVRHNFESRNSFLSNIDGDNAFHVLFKMCSQDLLC